MILTSEMFLIQIKMKIGEGEWLTSGLSFNLESEWKQEVHDYKPALTVIKPAHRALNLTPRLSNSVNCFFKSFCNLICKMGIREHNVTICLYHISGPG